MLTQPYHASIVCCGDWESSWSTYIPSPPPALQHRPEDIDKRAADMYSFALILWEIATTKVPFAGLSPMQVGIKVHMH